MAIIHFLNVMEGDCNIIQHDSGRITVIDVSNAENKEETAAERAKRASAAFQERLMRNPMPTGKTNYKQKHQPDNPIQYLRDHLGINSIFRFIISHPDMDHLDGIKDLFESFSVTNIWDTDNNKELDSVGGGYNQEDWEFYTSLRDGKTENRRTFFSGSPADFYTEDKISILAPTPALVNLANRSGDFNDASYVLLFTPPKKNGKKWKILFAGDSHDDTWDYILNKYNAEVSNIDVLFAPHHGRDSSRSYEFLKTLKPNLTLFGNASSEYLAYNKYPQTRITNNQAGYVILDINEDRIMIYVKNKEFATHFKKNPKRNWTDPVYDHGLHAYGIMQLIAR